MSLGNEELANVIAEAKLTQAERDDLSAGEKAKLPSKLPPRNPRHPVPRPHHLWEVNRPTHPHGSRNIIKGAEVQQPAKQIPSSPPVKK